MSCVNGGIAHRFYAEPDCTGAVVSQSQWNQAVTASVVELAATNAVQMDPELATVQTFMPEGVPHGVCFKLMEVNGRSAAGQLVDATQAVEFKGSWTCGVNMNATTGATRKLNSCLILLYNF